MNFIDDWHQKAREAEADMGPEDFWPAVLGDRLLGEHVRVVLGMLTMIDKEQLRGACCHSLQQISRLETLGPILDPSAWLSGKRTDNARNVKKMLRLLADLRDVLPDKAVPA